MSNNQAAQAKKQTPVVLLTNQPHKNYRVAAKVNCFTFSFHVSAPCESEARHIAYKQLIKTKGLKSSLILSVEECEPCLNLS